MKIFAVANQKGGVGKSTFVAHVSWAAEAAPVPPSRKRLRILLVDLDLQGSLSLTFPRVREGGDTLVASALFAAEESTAKPEYLADHLAIIRSDEGLEDWDGKGDDALIRRIGVRLRKFSNDFDLCLIDTPGSLGMKLTAALAAADAVVCPVAVGLYEIAGLAKLWGVIKAVKAKHNPSLQMMGMIPSMVNTKSPEELEGLEALRKKFGTAILPHVLGFRASVKQATARRRPVWTNTKGAGHLAAAKEWKAACNTVLKNLGSLRK